MLVLRLDLTQAPLASLYRPWGFSVCGPLPKPFCYKPLSCQLRLQKAEKLWHTTAMYSKRREAHLQAFAINPGSCHLQVTLLGMSQGTERANLPYAHKEKLLCGLPEAAMTKPRGISPLQHSPFGFGSGLVTSQTSYFREMLPSLF